LLRQSPFFAVFHPPGPLFAPFRPTWLRFSAVRTKAKRRAHVSHRNI
jgi:hypothetical protein